MTSAHSNECDPLPREFEHLGIENQAQTAICLSGGGIRSAAFCLGVLQGLARERVLTKFQYLSTVSGGGYIGSWLKSQLANPDSAEVQKFEDGLGGDSQEILRTLRRRASRYLTPHAGVLSLDTWKLIGTYLRNLILNWAVLVPLFVAAAAVVKSVPLLVNEELQSLMTAAGLSLPWHAEKLETVSALYVLGPPVLIVAIGLFVAFIQVAARKTDGLESFGASWLRRSALWLIVTASVVYGPRAMGDALAGALTGALTLGSGIVTAAASRFLNTPSSTADSPQQASKLVATAIMRVAAVIFVLALIAFVSWLASWLAAALPASLPGQIGLDHLYVAGLAIAASAVLAYMVDVNEYSLHGMYKNRLTRGFLRDGKDIALRDLDAEHAPGSKENVGAETSHSSPRKADPKKSLFHVINATVNTSTVFSFDRMGLPFSFTALHHGYWEDARAVFADNRSSDLTLGASMAISGAAANPNMGYFSSALTRFPMALLNLRLGWWLPQPETSPKPARANSWTTWGIWKAEFMGISDHKDKLINISDGGHFDNLGLYEMVRRKCKHVLVIDAGADPRREYQDLANVVRRVRIDFGAEITIDGLDIGEIPADQESGRRSVYKGTIHYRQNDSKAHNGMLVYVRPEPQAEEPTDISAYRARHSDFPHETTIDQWFSEAQFESYRRLGQFTIDKAVEFYLSDKGPSANLELLQSADGFVELLAESAYRMSRGVSPPTHAGGILYERLGSDEIRIVLVRSAPNTNWVLPKGHIEQGESQADAAKREVSEETGYQTASPTPFGIDDFERDQKTVYTAYFLMDVAGQNPDPDDCVEKRPILRLVFNTTAGREPNRTDIWRWDRAEWHPAKQPEQEWQEVPGDVQELLERIVRHLSVETASQ